MTSFICADKTVEVLVPLGVNKRLNYSLSNRNTQKCCNEKRYQESKTMISDRTIKTTVEVGRRKVNPSILKQRTQK